MLADEPNCAILIQMANTAQKSPDLNINLLPSEEPSAKTGEAIHWILTVGRYLIILTEIIALSTFLLGIYLSQQKNNLKNSIKTSQNTIEKFQTCDPKNEDSFCEDRFLNIQGQINSINSIKSNHFETNKVLGEFLTLLPQQMKLENLVIEGSDISFKGKLLTEQELQTLINSFNSSRKITALDIIELSKDISKDPYLRVSATAIIVKGGFE